MGEITLPETSSAIGVFLCDCGGELTHTLDFAQLAEFTSKHSKVKLVKRHHFLCGSEGRGEISKMLGEGAERVVIAACTPKLYEHYFRQLAHLLCQFQDLQNINVMK